jgi:hypothetical protein
MLQKQKTKSYNLKNSCEYRGDSIKPGIAKPNIA